MLAKSSTTLITVLAGIGGALLLFWLLNKLAELLPGNLGAPDQALPLHPAGVPGHRDLPGLPGRPDREQQLQGQLLAQLRRLPQLRPALSRSSEFQQTLFNTLLWIIIVPIVTVVLGLLVAVLADRLSTKGENFTKTIIFLPMAISMIGAATIWRFVYAYEPKGQTQIGIQNALLGIFDWGPVAWLQKSGFHSQQPAADADPAVGPDRILHGAALRGRQGRPRRHPRGRPDRRRRPSVRSSSGWSIPQIKGTMITVFITVTIGVMKIFDIVYVNTNGNFNTNVLGNEFYNQISTLLELRRRLGDRGDPHDRGDPDHVVPGAPLQVRGGRGMTDTSTTPVAATPSAKSRRKAYVVRCQPGQGRLVHQDRAPILVRALDRCRCSGRSSRRSGRSTPSTAAGGGPIFTHPVVVRQPDLRQLRQGDQRQRRTWAAPS